MPKKGLGNFHAAIFFSTALALPCPKSWIPHDYLSEGLTFFPALGSKEAKRSILQNYKVTDTHT